MPPRVLPAVDLGPEVVQLLLPQRPPMLMVDRIRGIDLEERRLLAVRHVSANEPLVTGHFPQLGVVPGVITVEGLAQAAGLLGRILDAAERFDGDLVDALSNLERGATLHPGYSASAGAACTTFLAAGQHLHVVGSTSIKLLAPIFPGCRLDHHVELTRRLGEGWWFRVRTEVNGRPVAEGTLGASTVPSSWPPQP